MMCPHCGHDKSRVTDTEARHDHILRYRICAKCAKKFTTIERVAVFVGRNVGHVEVERPEPGGVRQLPQLMPDPPREQTAAALPRPSRFKASLGDPDLARCDPDAQPLIVEWWNTARWSKHRGHATWTERAWKASVNRLALLPAHHQIALAEAGVEHGWQALKPEFLGLAEERPALASDSAPMPKDPAMLAALDSWQPQSA